MTGHRALEDSDMALIERVKMTPSLYDPRNLDFRLAYRKEQEWEVVGAMIGMTATEARRRWTCLRDRYSRELKQLRLHPEKNEYGNSPFFPSNGFPAQICAKAKKSSTQWIC
uniref:Transcription factor Adf-1 n=1 Tax=Bactrocera latifrons TaxID=174628 RepID=A0A0K8UX20_BACLA